MGRYCMFAFTHKKKIWEKNLFFLYVDITGKCMNFVLICMCRHIYIYMRPPPPHMAKQKQDDQLEHTYSSYVRIWDVALKTCQRRWMIRRSGERRSGISMLVAQRDDDDDIYIYICVCVCAFTQAYYICFLTNTLGKGMKFFILHSYWLNSIANDFYKNGFGIK